MLNSSNRPFKAAALLTGGVLAATALFQPAPAEAVEKEKLYKGGAVALGVLGGYWILKGKTVPGAVAGAGAYYAYKKGRDAERDNDRYNDNYYSNNDPRYSSSSGYNDRYPDYNYSRVAPGSNGGSNNSPIRLR